MNWRNKRVDCKKGLFLNLLYFLLIIQLTPTNAQTFSVSGYIKDMQGIYSLENPIPISATSNFQTTTFNQIHNRLNIAYQPITNIRIETGIRNRLMIGPMVKDLAGYSGMFELDNGLVDLSTNLIEKDNWFLNTSIDRLFLDYTLDKIQLRLGRQRINWGISLVWNPNDLFNAFSYIDFDYEERPGSDAALLTWYTSGSSNLDIAFKTDGLHQTTFASRYHFNTGSYDWQVVVGKNINDAILGAGWSGAIGPVSFRGEGSFFTPLAGKANLSKQAASITMEADYTLENDLYIHTALLYNSLGKDSVGINMFNPSNSLSAKRLSTDKYEVFGQISYPFSPIFNGSFAGMLNPIDGSCYLGPALTFSLQDNLELLLTSQIMLGEPGSEYGFAGNLVSAFGRLRWSF